jgi:hypothetical protein
MTGKKCCCLEFMAFMANGEVKFDEGLGRYYLHVIRWNDGVRYVSANFCPFCGADLRPSDPEPTMKNKLERRR